MKTQRQAKILEIIASTDIETQEQLLEALQSAGFRSTQATISRDIKELRLVKVMTPDGTYKYASAASENEAGMIGRIRNIFKECVVSINSAQNIVVIKTLPGLGSAAGYAVDALHQPDMVGSIAGDDTVFVVMSTTEKAEEFREQSRALLS